MFSGFQVINSFLFISIYFFFAIFLGIATAGGLHFLLKFLQSRLLAYEAPLYQIGQLLFFFKYTNSIFLLFLWQLPKIIKFYSTESIQRIKANSHCRYLSKMVYYTADEYFEMVRVYHACGNSSAAAARMYRDLHPNWGQPCRQTFVRAERRDRERHHDPDPSRRYDGGRPPNPMSYQEEDRILRYDLLNPWISVRDTGQLTLILQF